MIIQLVGSGLICATLLAFGFDFVIPVSSAVSAFCHAVKVAHGRKLRGTPRKRKCAKWQLRGRPSTGRSRRFSHYPSEAAGASPLR
jgi:hypothetical protein